MDDKELAAQLRVLIQTQVPTGLDVSTGYVSELSYVNPDLASLYHRTRTFNKMYASSVIQGAVSSMVSELAGGSYTIQASDPSDYNSVLAREFMKSVFLDSGTSVHEIIKKMATQIIIHGFCLSSPEIKIRNGKNANDKEYSSDHRDMLVGLRSINQINPAVLLNWDMSNSGTVISKPTGFIQQCINGTTNRIPMNRVIHSVHNPVNENPEGHSSLIGCYEDWWISNRLMQIFGVGFEKDVTGILVAKLPQDFMRKGATQDQKEFVKYMQKIVSQLKKNHQTGLILPSDVDASGNKMIDIETLSGSEYSKNSDQMLSAMQWLNSRILMSLGCEHLASDVGSTGGTYTSSNVKSKNYFSKLKDYQSTIEDSLNNIICMIWDLNNFPVELRPKFKFNPLAGSVDQATLGLVLQSNGTTGVITNDTNTENTIRSLIGLPQLEQVSDETTYDFTQIIPQYEDDLGALQDEVSEDRSLMELLWGIASELGDLGDEQDITKAVGDDNIHEEIMTLTPSQLQKIIDMLNTMDVVDPSDEGHSITDGIDSVNDILDVMTSLSDVDRNNVLLLLSSFPEDEESEIKTFSFKKPK